MTRGICLLAVAALVIPQPGAGQSALERAEELASHAQADSARAVLEFWWEAEWLDASRQQRQRGLWLRGRLTVDPFMAELDYQRLVEGFPGGLYSDQALSRLALLAVSAGDPLRAADYFEELVSEHPNSSLRDTARDWLRDNDREVRRARGLADADRVVAAPRSEPEVPVVPVLQPAGDFAVQLGAFSDEARAQALANRLQGAGYEARLVRVPANSLVRVRTGHFSDRDEAVRIMLEVRVAGFEATLVSNASREEEVR